MTSKSNKRHSRSERYDSADDFVVSDNDGHGPSKKPKREKEHHAATSQRKQAKASFPRNGSSKVDSNGDTYWEISRLRRVTISTFRGKTLVNVREYYEKDGEELPGKKGISMPIDQFSALIALLPEIESVLHQKGISVSRPDYDETVEESDKGAEAEKEDFSKESPRDAVITGRSNIETTSDEDEDEE